MRIQILWVYNLPVWKKALSTRNKHQQSVDENGSVVFNGLAHLTFNQRGLGSNPSGATFRGLPVFQSPKNRIIIPSQGLSRETTNLLWIVRLYHGILRQAFVYG